MGMHSGWKNKQLTEEEKRKISEIFHAPAAPDDIDVSEWSIGKLRAKCESHGIRAGKMKRPELSRRVKRIIYEESQPIEYKDGIVDELHATLDEYKKA